MRVLDKPNIYTCAECLTQLNFNLSPDYTYLTYYHPVVGATASDNCSQKDMEFTEPTKVLEK